MKNKNSIIYFLVLAVFLTGVFLYQYYSPKKFIWTPSFSKYDKQPFGSYVFDDIVSSSISDYQVKNKSFYQLLEFEEEILIDGYDFEDLEDLKVLEDLKDLKVEGEVGKPVEPLPLEQRCGFLVTENSVGFAAVDVASLLRLLERGHKVMLCLNSFPQLLCDSLCFTEQHDRYYYSIDRYVRDGMGRDSLLFGTDSLSLEQVYLVYPQVHPIYFKEGYASSSSPLWDDDKLIKEEKKRIRCDSMETLVRNGQGEPVAMRLYMGAGELFLVGTPLMFTNYGLLDEGNASYPFRLLSYMKGLPVIRLEAYGIVEDVSHSPLRYLLIQPSLRWAVYMATVTLLLCMIFTARRRQRVIPVALPPANESLRFTQLIGNLYYQKKDCKDILSKKYLYFCAEVKRLNGPELQTGEPDMELSRRLAEKMGQDADSIWPGFRELKYLLRTDAPVTETDMMRNINRMNEWLGYLN